MQLGQQDQQDPLALASQERRDQQDLRERQDPPVQELQVQLDQLVRVVLLVPAERTDLMVQREPPVHQVQQDLMGRQVPQVQRVQQVLMELPVQQELQVPLVQMGPQEPQEPQVQ